ncbi:MAG: cytochrome C [Shewanella sp.]|nr:cytochrome C [Shewanella sp.]MCF1429679.1 cytochrome C [Shewanella sp.]MCF1437431.1 cytochrome C [Shewanella sp.]MCF1456313.1 cytochrome C [Shewanella sp.]
MNRVATWMFACLMMSLSGVSAGAEYPVDPVSGLIMAPGWEMVNYQCSACHTSRIITQNAGDRKVWRDTIQWMVDSQGLWDLSDTWDPVLDYLSTYYAEKKVDMSKFRRLPLSAEQQPPMPSK